MKKLLLAASVFVIASCTASISIKAQEFNVDPGLEPAPKVAPLSPNKNKESEPNYPDTVQKTTMGCSCLLYTSPSPRDRQKSRMPSSA